MTHPSKVIPKPRVGAREDNTKPMLPGIFLIHNPTGFGYVVDNLAFSFEDEVELVVLRRSRTLYDTLYVLPLSEVRNEEEWQYVGF